MKKSGETPNLQRVCVRSLTSLSSNAYSLQFELPWSFTPGQMTAIRFEDQQQARFYSLASAPDSDLAEVIFTVVPEGQLTPRLSRVKPGDTTIEIQQPFGSFIDQGGESLWIANGTGIAPFLSMIRSGLTQGKTLIHGSRHREDFYYRSELSAALGPRYQACSSQEKSEEFYPGRLTDYLKTRPWPQDQRCYLCGSAAMIVEVRDMMITAGLAYKNILSEIYF